MDVHAFHNILLQGRAEAHGSKRSTMPRFRPLPKQTIYDAALKGDVAQMTLQVQVVCDDLHHPIIEDLGMHSFQMVQTVSNTSHRVHGVPKMKHASLGSGVGR